MGTHKTLVSCITPGVTRIIILTAVVQILREIYDTRVSDTTLHDVLVKLDLDPLQDALERDVKMALRNHELPKASFPVRITAIDGKSIAGV